VGQKVHPYGFRLGVTKTWRSRWFAKADYAKLLKEDLDLKDSLRDRLKAAGVSSVEVDRPGNKLRVTIRTSRPGIIIGRKGAEIEKLKTDLAKKTKREVFIDIQEVHKPELDAQLVAESIALQLEKRVAFRRAMRKAVDSALRFGCKGIKVRVSGRLNGAEIARSEWYLQGQLPLHTLRADVDYGFAQAYTTYGVIGVKTWIFRGEVLTKQEEEQRAACRVSGCRIRLMLHAREGDEIDIESEAQLFQDVERTNGNTAMRWVGKRLGEEEQPRPGHGGKSPMSRAGSLVGLQSWPAPE